MTGGLEEKTRWRIIDWLGVHYFTDHFTDTVNTPFERYFKGHFTTELAELGV